MESPKFSLEKIIAKTRDFSLVKSTLEGDGKAFEKLVSLYKKRVFSLGRSFFRRVEDAEDFAQEVFMKAYMNLSSFRGESSFSTWLTRVAYNLGVNSLKRKNDSNLDNEEFLESKDLTPEEELVRKFTIEAVQEAVKELPENYGICLELYFFHDLSYEEISQVTGFPMNTLKSHIFRGKKILQQKLKGYLDCNYIEEK